MTRDTYLLDHGWVGEKQRLALIGVVLDPGTRRHLAATGVGAGWRCLEVGAGIGSVAQWLCEQVGPSGEVVATDLDVGFVSQIDRPNLVVRRHDITRDDLEEAAFDLVHTRLVLEHLRSRDVALERMVRALRPGGWLVVEALQWTSVHVASARPHNPYARAVRLVSPVLRLVIEVLRPAGVSLEVGHRLPAMFATAGLVDVSAEGRSLFISAGTPAAEMAELSLDRVRDLLADPPPALRDAPAWSPVGLIFRSPALTAALARRVERISAAVTGGDNWTMIPAMVAASGRRPPA